MRRIYRTEFHSAHHIEKHPHCGATHGHSYQLQVEVDFDEYVWFDFGDLKKIVDGIVTPYDHVDMGDMTCEKLARIIQTKVAHQMDMVFDIDYTVTVELWETSHFGVRT